MEIENLNLQKQIDDKIIEMTDNIKLKTINENRLQSDFCISNIISLLA